MVWLLTYPLFLLLINLAVGTIVLLIVTAYSTWAFGLAVGILSFLTIINSIRIKDFPLAPVFPGRGWSIFLLIVAIGSSITFRVMGKDLIDTYGDDFGNSKAKAAMRNKIYVVSPAYCYWEKENKWIVLDNETKAISLKERKDIPEGSGEIYLKMRLEDKIGRFDGPVIWVPILRVSKRSVPSDSSADVYLPPSARVKKEGEKKIGEALEISFSPEQVVARDIHKKAPDKLLLALDGFKQGETFELMEDFSFRVRGDNPESWILIGGLKVGLPIKGERVVLSKGQKYLIHNQSADFGIFSNGGEIYDFSQLKIRKVL